MKRIAILTALLLLTIPNLQCSVIRKVFTHRQKSEVDSTAFVHVQAANSYIDTSKTKATQHAQKTTDESYTETTLTITGPAETGHRKSVMQIANDLVLDTSSNLDTIKYTSASNPANQLLLYLSSTSPKHPVAELRKDGKDSACNFSSITLNTKTGSKHTVEDITQSQESKAAKIINNSIDSSAAVVEHKKTQEIVKNKDVTHRRGGWVWMGIAALILGLAAVIFYFWNYRKKSI